MRFPWIRRPHNPVSDFEPLIHAASEGYVDVVVFLLNLGLDPNYESWAKIKFSIFDPIAGDPIGQPLHFAVTNGHCEIVELLIKGGADINSTKCDPKELGLTERWSPPCTTPLDLAELANHHEIALFLRKHGALRGSELD